MEYVVRRGSQFSQTKCELTSSYKDNTINFCKVKNTHTYIKNVTTQIIFISKLSIRKSLDKLTHHMLMRYF